MARASTAKANMAAAEKHERQTGMRANMQMLGWHASKRSKIDGVPLAFSRGAIGDGWRISKTRQGTWYVARITRMPALRYITTRRVDGPEFAGPVAAAIWLQVEIANGTVRFRES